MCGIPMTPPPDAVAGRRLTLEQALEHIGGAGGIISDHGWQLIKDNAEDYIWKYPDGLAWCTACHERLEGVHAKHNDWITCPTCGKTVRFRHEARGHSTVYDEFYLYEWRKSLTDAETVTLTVAHVWRDSRYPNPESAPLRVAPSALYIFRPDRAATVYKGSIWRDDDERAIRRGLGMRGWTRVNSVAPEHTKTCCREIVMDEAQFRRALEGTRIGRTFWLLCRESNRVDTLELTAIANCARRPWLEYLYKAGQPALAAQLLRLDRLSPDVVPHPRAKTPRELLGLTEAWWADVKKGGVRLNTENVCGLSMLRRMGLEKMKLKEALAALSGNAWWVEHIAPHRDGRNPRWTKSIGDILNAAGVPDKLKRKIYRRILADKEGIQEWKDYYEALRELGEDMTDSALMLPRDLHAMHDRMQERLRVLHEEARAKELALKEMAFRKRLKKLRTDYCFEACGLTLRPYETAQEIIAEGKALSICIGSYARRYLDGGTIICCLRRADAPDVPWRAVEFSMQDGRLVQDRGYKNDWAAGPNGGKTLDEETKALLKQFWAAFEAWRTRKRRKTA